MKIHNIPHSNRDISLLVEIYLKL